MACLNKGPSLQVCATQRAIAESLTKAFHGYPTIGPEGPLERPKGLMGLEVEIPGIASMA
jgi:hypothetical protein